MRLVALCALCCVTCFHGSVTGAYILLENEVDDNHPNSIDDVESDKLDNYPYNIDKSEIPAIVEDYLAANPDIEGDSRLASSDTEEDSYAKGKPAMVNDPVYASEDARYDVEANGKRGNTNGIDYSGEDARYIEASGKRSEANAPEYADEDEGNKERRNSQDGDDEDDNEEEDDDTDNDRMIMGMKGWHFLILSLFLTFGLACVFVCGGYVYCFVVDNEPMWCCNEDCFCPDSCAEWHQSRYKDGGAWYRRWKADEAEKKAMRADIKMYGPLPQRPEYQPRNSKQKARAGK